MNKKGFTLIELLVSFALITIVSLSLFKTVLTVQKKSIKDLSYNQYLSFAASFSSNIQKDFTGDKITSFSSCGNNCYEILYENAGTKEIKIDRTNNTMSYGSINEKLPNNYIFYGDLILELNKIDGIPADNYNSIFILKIPIKSNLTDDYSNIVYTYQYDDRVGEAPASVFKILTVDPNGGTYGGSSSSTLYYLLPNSTQDVNIPLRSNYIFNGWTRTCSACLVGNTYTMGASDDTLVAQWLNYSSMYTYTGSSTVVDDGNGNWRIKFLTSGTLTPLIDMTVDAFLVGGGGAGGISADNGLKSGGGGGAGGYTGTYSGITLSANTPYIITIGAGGIHSTAASGYGGTGGTTSAFGYSKAGGTGGYGYMGDANTHTGGTGGSNGGAGRCGTGYAGNSYGSAAQGSTTCEFGEGTTTSCTNGNSYAYAGGGGGGGGNGGGGGAAGIAGAGAGAGVGGCTGGYGTANTGGGGGGAYSKGTCYGGDGGSGIVIIRNAR